MKYILDDPTEKDRDALLDWLAAWGPDESVVIPYSARLLGRGYEQWLADTRRIVTQPDGGFVPASTWFFREAGKPEILGVLNLRHELNDFLLNFGGHIGHGLRPEARGQGLGKIMLTLGLEKARGLGIKKLLICNDSQNLASRALNRSCGGVFENEVPEGDRFTQRHWIALD